MERSNLFNHLLRIFDEGLSMNTTELEFGTLEVTVENRSQDKKITFLAKGMEDAKQKAAEWQVGQMLLNCDDFEEIVMFLAQRKKLKKNMPLSAIPSISGTARNAAILAEVMGFMTCGLSWRGLIS